MLRCRMPGGVITPAQWLGIDEFAASHTMYGSIRITNRQTFQYHGVLKQNIRPVHQWLHQLGLDSIATAGDVNRNVLCTSNPVESELHVQAWEWAKKISEHLLPKSKAYAEIWLDGEKVQSTDTDTLEPILGKSYLPRKFKTTVIVPPQNDVDLHANDLNFVAIAQQGQLVGFNVLIGGGLSMERMGFAFEAIRPYEFTDRGDRIGWVHGIDKKWHLTLFIENGRVLDYPGRPIKTGLREIAKIHKGDFRLTANQNLIVANVEAAEKAAIEKLARDHGLISDNVTVQRENSMACVALPTCPLAMAEAERFLPSFIDKMDAIMARHGLQDDFIVTRVTGCPNGCGRAMLAEVGLVGKAVGRYNLHLGGNRIGTRIPRLYKENITEQQILEILDEQIGHWAIARHEQEGFGDFLIRTGFIKPVVNPSVDFHDASKVADVAAVV